MGQTSSKVACTVLSFGVAIAGICVGIAAAAAVVPLGLPVAIALFAVGGGLVSAGISTITKTIRNDEFSWEDTARCAGLSFVTGAISGAICGPFGHVGAGLPLLQGVGVAAAGGALSGLVSSVVQNAINGRPTFQNTLQSTLIGGLSGAVGFCGGSLIQSSGLQKQGMQFLTIDNLKYVVAKAGMGAVTGAIGGGLGALVTGDKNVVGRAVEGAVIGGSVALASAAVANGAKAFAKQMFDDKEKARFASQKHQFMASARTEHVEKHISKNPEVFAERLQSEPHLRACSGYPNADGVQQVMENFDAAVTDHVRQLQSQVLQKLDEINAAKVDPQMKDIVQIKQQELNLLMTRGGEIRVTVPANTPSFGVFNQGSEAFLRKDIQNHNVHFFKGSLGRSADARVFATLPVKDLENLWKSRWIATGARTPPINTIYPVVEEGLQVNDIPLAPHLAQESARVNLCNDNFLAAQCQQRTIDKCHSRINRSKKEA
ncbi:hypothetical protein BCR33DRAFT_851571 [Rhizoclosmatium globosum]|uniref:Uncharacterized protein n=1 Tax=Rhizoclosmatium globosum TaxID=329046 RepID=A0A1Y2C644_9FUNG|nr:hypothetical protein BCR33DRAFT_851571 [Rhizoclosmatium globosum]|eukprot:ORY42508.1 hypothetical protein BCR33DRAFT_851571 [Rhizoclosmatium globosum]